jgi:hypothetical protein
MPLRMRIVFPEALRSEVEHLASLLARVPRLQELQMPLEVELFPSDCVDSNKLLFSDASLEDLAVAISEWIRPVRIQALNLVGSEAAPFHLVLWIAEVPLPGYEGPIARAPVLTRRRCDQCGRPLTMAGGYICQVCGSESE